VLLYFQRPNIATAAAGAGACAGVGSSLSLLHACLICSAWHRPQSLHSAFFWSLQVSQMPKGHLLLQAGCTVSARPGPLYAPSLRLRRRLHPNSLRRPLTRRFRRPLRPCWCLLPNRPLIRCLVFLIMRLRRRLRRCWGLGRNRRLTRIPMLRLRRRLRRNRPLTRRLTGPLRRCWGLRWNSGFFLLRMRRRLRRKRPLTRRLTGPLRRCWGLRRNRG